MPATLDLSAVSAVPPDTIREARRILARRVRQARRKGAGTIPLPCVADGWSIQCRRAVIAAYDFELGGLGKGMVETWRGEVPNLQIDNVLVGVSTIATERPRMGTAAVVAVLHEALRFLGME